MTGRGDDDESADQDDEFNDDSSLSSSTGRNSPDQPSRSADPDSPTQSLVAGRIIGVDPGLRRTGYAVLDVANRRPRIVEAGLIKLDPNRSLADRLVELNREFRDLLAEYRPCAVAIEELYGHYERPTTAILMGHARGVLLCAARATGAEIAGYAATQVKRTLCGDGHAPKEQIQRAVMFEFGLREPPKPADVADAMAVALCHSGELGVDR